jgi:hypothetical protein
MAIDIWGVWAKPEGTPDCLRVPYDQPEFADDVIESQGSKETDAMVILHEDALLKLKAKYANHEDRKIQKTIDVWLKQMEEAGQEFIRLVVNY